jgi:hypothetical protein
LRNLVPVVAVIAACVSAGSFGLKPNRLAPPWNVVRHTLFPAVVGQPGTSCAATREKRKTANEKRAIARQNRGANTMNCNDASKGEGGSTVLWPDYDGQGEVLTGAPRHLGHGLRHLRSCFQACTNSCTARAGGNVWLLMMRHSRYARS